MRVRRLDGNPIIAPNEHIGDNINGPSLIAAPPWVTEPLARYYLYFAHHLGDHIRFAHAEELTGPWTNLDGGVLSLHDSRFPTEPASSDPVPDGWTSQFPWHIASPDVHVLDGEVRMYFHGLADMQGAQRTRLAVSSDGLRFDVLPDILCPSYLRAFRWDGWWYGVAQNGVVYRSPDGVQPFEAGPHLWPGMRHGAVLLRGATMYFFYSRWGDAPERIVCSTVELDREWMSWSASDALEVLAPTEAWEGADLEVRASVPGAATKPLHEVRDPAIFEDDDRLLLLYSVAGESGIGIASLEV